MGRLIHRNKGQQMRSRHKKSPKTWRELGGRHVQDLENCKALKTLSEKIKNVKQFSSEACIFKVPEELRKANSQAYTPLTISIGPYHYHHGKMERLKELYTPLTISIGPYHHTKPELRKMERLKELYTQSFLKRRAGVGVEECWKKLKDLQGRAESYYGDLDDIKFVNDDEFVEILLLDGCFIVEFVIRSFLGGRQEYNDDPIYMISGMESNIVRDMLLLENQLPFFVLQALYDMISNRPGNLEFSEMVKLAFCNKIPKMNINSLLQTKVNHQEIKHLLQLVHILCQPQPQPQNNRQIQQLEEAYACSSCCFWKQPQEGGGGGSDIESHSLTNGQGRHRHWAGFLCKFWEQPQQSTDDHEVELCSIRTASELQEAGVDFKPNSTKTRSLFDIKFNHGGVLEIPPFPLLDPTEAFLRNLIAYEQQLDVRPMYFTDYAKFMDDLINTEKDVNLLALKDVLSNGLADDKEVTHLFNNLCQGVRPSNIDHFYYKDVYKELNRHYKKSWNVAMEKLRRNYFHSPWAGISTFAAILLLSLAIAQTVLSALDMHK